VHKVHKFHNITVPIGKERIDEGSRSEDKTLLYKQVKKIP
jgi:hypothetical protein